MKEQKKYEFENKNYYFDMKALCKIDIGNNTIIDLPHSRDDITGLQNSVEVSVDGTVPLNGQSMSVSLAESLIRKGKEINVELYVHLWDKYAEVDACTTDEEVALVVWEYDIEQVYTLSQGS